MLRFAKPGLPPAFLVLMPVSLAAILAPDSAMADPPDAGADQHAAGSQETATESTQENNQAAGMHIPRAPLRSDPNERSVWEFYRASWSGAADARIIVDKMGESFRSYG
jgi:hypothetical protein